MNSDTCSSTSSVRSIPVTTPWRDLVLALAMAVFTFGCGWVHVFLTPPGAPPDEWAHITHVKEIAVDGHLLPDYAHSRILPAAKTGNYLGHPPLYYSTLGLTGRLLEWGDPVTHFKRYRALSVSMVAMGMLLWTLAGRAFGLPSLYLVAITAALNAIPMFPYLAGSINNDNLAFLSVAISIYGISLLQRYPRLAYYIGAFGLLIALLTKATAALFLLAFFCFWLIPTLRGPRSPLRDKHFLIALGTMSLLLAIYYIPTLIKYGTPFPRLSLMYSKLPPPEHPVGLVAVIAEFSAQLWQRLPYIASHASLLPLAGLLEKLLYVMLLLPAFAWIVSRWAAPAREVDRLGNAFLLALVSTILVHFLVVWNAYNAHGVFAGLQPRYYNYALPGLFLIGFLRQADSKACRFLFAAFALAAAALISVSPTSTAQASLARSSMPMPERLNLPTGSKASGQQTIRITINDQPAGYLDSFKRKGTNVSVSGWAIDIASQKPARRVWVFLKDQLIGTAPTGHQRPDVGKALASIKAAQSGFRLEIKGLAGQVPECDLRLAAEQGDGRMAPLRRPKCDSSGK